jgi:hypothetical protein
MKTLKTFENWFNGNKKHQYHKDWKTISIISKITGKEIIYNPFDREILNDDNIGKFVVLNNYTFDIIEVEIKYREELINFINNNVGKITMAKLSGGEAFYDIQYDNIPNNLQEYFTPRTYDDNCRYLITNKCDFISNNYETCNTYIISKKYNI